MMNQYDSTVAYPQIEPPKQDFMPINLPFTPVLVNKKELKFNQLVEEESMPFESQSSELNQVKLMDKNLLENKNLFN